MKWHLKHLNVQGSPQFQMRVESKTYIIQKIYVKHPKIYKWKLFIHVWKYIRQKYEGADKQYLVKSDFFNVVISDFIFNISDKDCNINAKCQIRLKLF